MRRSDNFKWLHDPLSIYFLVHWRPIRSMSYQWVHQGGICFKSNVLCNLCGQEEGMYICSLENISLNFFLSIRYDKKWLVIEDSTIAKGILIQFQVKVFLVWAQVNSFMYTASLKMKITCQCWWVIGFSLDSFKETIAFMFWTSSKGCSTWFNLHPTGSIYSLVPVF